MFCIIWSERKQKYIVQSIADLTMEERMGVISTYRFERDAWKAVKSMKKKYRHSVRLKDIIEVK